jgi:hypothetical protein
MASVAVAARFSNQYPTVSRQYSLKEPINDSCRRRYLTVSAAAELLHQSAAARNRRALYAGAGIFLSNLEWVSSVHTYVLARSGAIAFCICSRITKREYRSRFGFQSIGCLGSMTFLLKVVFTAITQHITMR